MKSRILEKVFGGIFIICSSLSLNAQTWNSFATFPGVARGAAISFSLNGKGYVGTGFSSGTLLNDLWEYDPASDHWTQKNNFTGPARYSASAFVIGNKAYVGLGNTSYPSASYTNDLWEYNPGTDTWTQVASFPGAARYGAGAMSINGKGYVGCGWNGSYYNDFYEYDPGTDSWATKANFAGGTRQAIITFTIDNIGFFGMGNANGTTMNDLWSYDPVLDLWTQKTSMTGSARDASTGFALGSSAYVGLGNSTFPPSTFLNDFWKYNSATDSWTTSTSFTASARYSVVNFVIDCIAYVGTGVDGNWSPSSLHSDFYKFGTNTTVSFSGLDTLNCIYDSPNALVGTPSGGTFSGMGISGNNFYPSTAGEGVFQITYSYTNGTGCVFSSVQQVHVTKCTDGIEQINSPTFSLYPNPLNRDSKIYFSGLNADRLHLSLCDLTGHLVITSELISETNSSSLPISFSNLEPGIYFLNISDGSTIQSMKLVVMK